MTRTDVPEDVRRLANRNAIESLRSWAADRRRESVDPVQYREDLLFADELDKAARALTGEYEATVLRRWADRFMEERGDQHGIVTWFHLQASAIEARIREGQDGTLHT